jgi:hypothetical protein
MPNYDKFDPIAGGSRAKLAAALTLTNGGFIGAVSLNAAGKVVPGTAGQSGLFGVLVKNVARGPVQRWDTSLQSGTPNPNAPIGAMANDVVDVMQHGDIVGLDKTAFPAGSKVYTNAAGVLSTTSASGSIQVGWTVEAGRLVVRVGPNAVPAA